MNRRNFLKTLVLLPFVKFEIEPKPDVPQITAFEPDDIIINSRTKFTYPNGPITFIHRHEGVYIGDGTKDREINLGFEPEFVITKLE